MIVGRHSDSLRRNQADHRDVAADANLIALGHLSIKTCVAHTQAVAKSKSCLARQPVVTHSVNCCL